MTPFQGNCTSGLVLYKLYYHALFHNLEIMRKPFSIGGGGINSPSITQMEGLSSLVIFSFKTLFLYKTLVQPHSLYFIEVETKFCLGGSY